MEELTRQDRARLTFQTLWRAAMLAPTGPAISRLTLSRRIGKGTPYRELLVSSGGQPLRISKIQIRVPRTREGAVSR